MSLFNCPCHGACKNCMLGCAKVNKIRKNDLKIVLAGNPNVGKSVLFNALSGFYVEISNFPGTTVDISRANTEFGELIDTPGAYSLGNYSDDENVTREILKSADVVVNVAGALTLERDLFLTQQLIDIGFPLILVVNQIDEARKNGVRINCDVLQEDLGIRVIPCVATEKKGIAELTEALLSNDAHISNKVIPAIKEIRNTDESIAESLSNVLEAEAKDCETKDKIYSQRKETVLAISKKAVKHCGKNFDILSTIGELLLNPFIGGIVALGLLYLLFQILGVFIAGDVVDFLFNKLDTVYVPIITKIVDKIIVFPLFNQILAGEFGILTMSVKIVFGVLLPLISAFYLFMALLEDSGYLPRLAVLADNVLNKIGLNGRAVIPLILGFGCGALGTITTRILGSRKERTIATAILGVTIPCAAQQGIITALLAAIGGFKVWLLYIFIIFVFMVLTGTVLNKLLKGEATDLLIDLPPIRIPLFKNIVEKTFFRVWNFLSEAVPLFIISSVMISVLNFVGFLKWLQQALAPVVVNMLHLPAQFSDVFVMGLIRRDFASVGLLGMAGLEDSARTLSDLQILTASIVVTLFVPCIAALIVIFKERGIKEAVILWLSTFTISVAAGAVVARTFGFLFS